MEPRAHHVLIGLFTVLMFSAALGFALWLSKASSDQETHDFDVIFNEAVSGLSAGSAVQYSGIKVGDVISLRLDPNDPRKVRAHIRVSASTPIKEDTRARLSITGITGASLIQLHSGTPESPMLISKGDQRAEIIADRSPLTRLMSNGEDLVLSVTRLLNRANQLFSRALIRDGAGNPTTLTVTAIDILTVTYQLRLYRPTTDIVSTVCSTAVYTMLVAQAVGAVYTLRQYITTVPETTWHRMT